MRSSYLTCPAVLYREEDQDDNWNEEKESDEVGCLQDRRSLTGRSNEDHRLAERERERERKSDVRVFLDSSCPRHKGSRGVVAHLQGKEDGEEDVEVVVVLWVHETVEALCNFWDHPGHPLVLGD